MLQMDKVIARLNKGWCKNTLRNTNDECCIYGAINYAHHNSYEYAYGGFFSRDDLNRSYINEYADVLLPIIIAEFPDRVRGNGPEACNRVVAFNNHPDTTLDDILLVCEKARANESLSAILPDEMSTPST